LIGANTPKNTLQRVASVLLLLDLGLSLSSFCAICLLVTRKQKNTMESRKQRDYRIAQKLQHEFVRIAPFPLFALQLAHVLNAIHAPAAYACPLLTSMFINASDVHGYGAAKIVNSSNIQTYATPFCKRYASVFATWSARIGEECTRVISAAAPVDLATSELVQSCTEYVYFNDEVRNPTTPQSALKMLLMSEAPRTFENNPIHIVRRMCWTADHCDEFLTLLSFPLVLFNALDVVPYVIELEGGAGHKPKRKRHPKKSKSPRSSPSKNRTRARRS
jgi:hypothetical protein